MDDKNQQINNLENKLKNQDKLKLLLRDTITRKGEKINQMKKG